LKKKILIANWKMNIGLKQSLKLYKAYSAKIKVSKNTTLVTLPSAHTISFLNQIKLKNKSKLGAQNCSQFLEGSYTGEISAKMIKEIGCEYVLLGHSERRHFFNENKISLKNKIDNAKKNKLNIIFCVGENLLEYKKKLSKNVIRNQLKNVFSKSFDFSKIIIAYEPVWAIGTSKTPLLQEINEIHYYIKNFFKKSLNVSNIMVLYGGSVNKKNSKDIFKLEYVDGGLIGGSSLDANNFAKIYKNLC